MNSVRNSEKRKDIPMIKKEKTDMKYPSTLRKLRSCFDKDKGYFIRLWQTTKGDWKRSLVIFVGLMCLFALMLLYLYSQLIGTIIFEASWVVVWIIMAIALLLINRNAKVKKTVPRKFDPMSLGTLHFGFALSLWTIWASKQISDHQISDWPTFIIAIIISLISIAFFIAVYSWRMRTFLNTLAAPYLIELTFIAFSFGFVFGVLGSLPAFPQTSRVIIESVVYFGFAWIVTILLIMVRDVKYELARFLFIVFFLIVAAIRFHTLDMIGIIAGAVLVVIAILAYLVTTDRLHPYGEVFEK